ncbi:MAG: aminopeptidase N [Methylococcales bacterium]
MKEASPQTIYLKDYCLPDFLIHTVDLNLELDQDTTLVHSTMRVRRNPVSQHSESALVLHGEDLELGAIHINKQSLSETDYQVSDHNLVIHNTPDDEFTLEIVTTINPAKNTQLQGLYKSKDMLCTQCEAQGFRRITYFLDQPDIMARFTTTLVANKIDYPILLSNGNPIDRGELDDGRHWVKWEDPFPKPCYLFAIVAGKLACLEDSYTTISGRSIQLEVYVEANDIDKCGHAMRSLQASMAWDEQNYGREYDLDLYMIVAVSHFNMGAMENKGLNIFNTQYVLARPDTATDFDYEHIEGVIGHEYFHNWTGNRITCRDWFQLSLKEGLTVFRDQQFTADQTSVAVKRINDVNTLRTRQFQEDAGPLAHPVRPDSYIEINNFYTSTVYEKGAEVVRMIHTLLGAEGFRAGMDLYFQRHDGEAVTTDDFVKCMEDSTQIDLTQFRRWYGQAGTPELKLDTKYDAQQQKFTIDITQHSVPTPNQPDKQALHIPVRLALLGKDGQAINLHMDSSNNTDTPTEVLLQITEQKQTFSFHNVDFEPVVSALRGFSAPVRVSQQQSMDELAFLAQHDSDTFNRWSAIQNLFSQIIIDLVDDASRPVAQQLLKTFEKIITLDWDDQAYLALLLTLPSEQYLASQMQVVNPEGIYHARNTVRKKLAALLQSKLLNHYQQATQHETNEISNQAAAQRKLKNVCLSYLASLQTEDNYLLCTQQFEQAGNMTDELAALVAIVHNSHPDRDKYLDQFYQKWQSEALVIDKWFSLQAMSPLINTLETVEALTQHADFDLNTPNRVRSLVSAFSVNNPLHFHNSTGTGYDFLLRQVQQLDRLNPQIAARIVTPLTQWKQHTSERQHAMKQALQTLVSDADISRDLYEIVNKSL